MVTIIVVEREHVLGIAVSSCLAVAFLELVLVDASVLQREAAVKKVVRGVGILNLIEGQLSRAADRHADVRDCRLVRDAQFLPRGAIDIPCHAAVGELDADGVVVQVIVYPCYPASGIAQERTGVVVASAVLLVICYYFLFHLVYL